MLLTLLLLAILVVIFVAKGLWWYFVELACLPPGPTPFPFYGNVIPKDVHPGLCQWFSVLREKYGDIFTIYRGSSPTVIVNGYQAVKEILSRNGHVVYDRGDHHDILNVLHENTGLVWNELAFKGLRKISAEVLKQCSERNRKSEVCLLNDKLSYMLLCFENNQYEPLDINILLRDLVSYSICNTLFGQKDSVLDEERFKQAITLHHATLIQCSRLSTLVNASYTKYLPGFREKWSLFNREKRRFQDFIQMELNQHRSATEDDNDNFIQAFIRNEKKYSLTEADCHATIMQMMMAGLDAVHGTLMWLFLYLVVHEDVQNKLAEEIQNKIGYEARPLARQLTEMPYCHTVINEVLRISNVAFTSLPYRNKEDLCVAGITIPKNSSLTLNFVSIHQDPKLFHEPEKFKPERFLDSNGNLKKFDYFVPFSIGRRACIGESFSKANIFVIMSSILQEYVISKVDGEDYSLEPCQSFLSIPQPYKIKLTKRTCRV